MELWFILATAGTLFSGLGAFSVKVAAHRNYDGALLVLIAPMFVFIGVVPLALWLEGSDVNLWLYFVAFVSGVIAAFGAILKVAALRYIDTTIYFPLFKLVSPLLAIIFGVVLFGESFSAAEWFGLLMSLLVPLLLINKPEQGRQNNLFMGLLMVLITGFISALAAIIQKYITDVSNDILWLLVGANTGVLIGGLLVYWWKNRNQEILAGMRDSLTRDFLWLALWRGVIMTLGFASVLYAYNLGGSLGVVYTINSLYILVPIVLSIILYREHWNAQKVTAIVLSILALGFMA